MFDEDLEFARKMVELYRMTDAYVMDIGFIFHGWKIIEVNCINNVEIYNVDL